MKLGAVVCLKCAIFNRLFGMIGQNQQAYKISYIRDYSDSVSLFAPSIIIELTVVRTGKGPA